MSRIGNAPVPLPAGVDVAVEGSTVTVTGPKGTLARTFSDRIGFAVADGRIVVSRRNDERQSRALHGLSRALVANMVTGVSTGFVRELQMVGVGYRAALQGNTLELLVGFSHPVRMTAPEGISFEVPEPTRIVVRGIDRERVGQVAAEIRRVRPPEPYKGKGIRYVDEKVRRKAGKAGVTGR
ncbi:MAG TPA: 50S ribosomal protein L6 [Acidimicrobiia bacterium]|jgi:large subunit ribosomal protein L6|nr:50S ribosomal protein L6 [Acidimicrobiia bacterium]